MRTVAIYHRADFDGLFCREIVRKFRPEAELIGWDYGDPVPSVPEDCRLYILDLSVPELMDHKGLIWIDHHKSAIERYRRTIPGIRLDGVAACRLAWQWFNRELAITSLMMGRDLFVNRQVIEPMSVRLAGEYDIWDHRDPNVALFQSGLRSQDLKWDVLLGDGDDAEDYCRHLIECGGYVAYARAEGMKRMMTEGAFELAWQGLRFVAINAAGLSSDAYAHAEGSYDAGLAFCWAPKKRKWKVSMRALRPDLDLSEIAVAHGGGGHRAACGFECEMLPFDL